MSKNICVALICCKIRSVGSIVIWNCKDRNIFYIKHNYLNKFI